MSILKKINIIIWIVLLSFVYGSHAGSQQTGNNEAPGNHSALKKLSPMKTPAFNGSRVIVRLKKNSPDKGQSNHKYDKLLKLRNPTIIQRLKQRTEERRATILQALGKNRHSLTKRSWIPFLRRQAKNPAPPLNSRSLWLANSIAVTVTKEDLEELKKNPNVEEIVKNSILSVSPIAMGSGENPLKGEDLWNHTLIGLEAARELGLDGTGIRIGQLDTGINPDLPDMAGKLVGWAEFGWNGEIINSQPHETHASGHGTHVASVMIGDTTGVAPGAELIAALVLPGGYGTLEQVLAGMQWVIDPDGDPETDDGAQIVNMSLGMRGTSQVLREAVINMVASGVLPVCAIGNSGPGETYSPGNVPEAVGVGAIDEDDGYLLFSSGGEACWDDLCITKPDITAPGEHILGLDQAGAYQTMSGTSLAAPHVAGAAALLMQYNPQLTVSGLKSFLLRSSHDLGMRNQRPDEHYGWGRLDLEAATFFMDKYAQRFKSADLVLEDTAKNFLGLKVNRFLTFFSDGIDGFIADQSSHLSFMNTGESSIKTAGMADLDGDGIQDIIITESATAEDGGFIISYCVFRSLNHDPFSGNKETWFSYHSSAPEPYELIGIADVNGDKKSDLILASRESGRFTESIDIFALLSDGIKFYLSSEETWAGFYINKALYKFSFLTGDVNGDGRADLVLEKSNKYYPDYNPVIYETMISTGEQFESSFGRQSLYIYPMQYGGNTKFKKFADLNGDGFEDLILIYQNGNNIGANIYYSNASSLFIYSGRWLSIELENENSGINMGDINRDGIDDIIINYLDQDAGSAIFRIYPADMANKSFYPGEETEINLNQWSLSENFKITGVGDAGLGNWEQ